MCFIFKWFCGCDCSCLEPQEDWSITQDAKAGEYGAGNSIRFDLAALITYLRYRLVVQKGEKPWRLEQTLLCSNRYKAAILYG